MLLHDNKARRFSPDGAVPAVVLSIAPGFYQALSADFECGLSRDTLLWSISEDIFPIYVMSLFSMTLFPVHDLQVARIAARDLHS